ncbi:uncharacterized protein LOC131670096 [Phymastichus coffea]|uniref:uncharacterized protein LOC131670096 n=1 Tax=Phymastichus coffea TaxID=108790 RepID=UPI00273C8D34|nr:uncharacterized protein LOC131670096 [Phymastichus coffea]
MASAPTPAEVNDTSNPAALALQLQQVQQIQQQLLNANASRCKLPQFWKAAPEAWFGQRYNLVIAALGEDTVNELLDVVQNPPATDMYATLKRRMLERFAQTNEQCLRKLLNDIKPEGKKPSELLREMRILAGKSVTDEALKVKWLALLPASSQGVLTVLDGALDKLAEAADKLADIAPTPAVAAVKAYSRSSSPHRQDHAMAKEMANMTALMSRLLATAEQTNEAIRVLSQQRSQGRGRSRSRGRAGTPATQAQQGHCYYHQRFGDGALKFQEAHGSGLPKENRLHVFDRNSRLSFLVDSGSVVSLLPRSAVKEATQLVQQLLTLTAANMSPIATFSRTLLTLNIGLCRDFEWPFIIADIPGAIIGADFLAHAGIMVDLQSQRLIDAITALATRGQLSAVSHHTVAILHDPAEDLTTRSLFDALLVEYADLTKPSSRKATLNGAPVTHFIRTTEPPVFERPRPLFGDRLKGTKAAVKELMDAGLVRPSSSQWASPLHLVEKNDGSGTFRITGDYRRLNAITEPDRYPLPVIEHLLHGCHGGKVFTVVDLKRAFYQVPMAEEDICKTAVITPFGLIDFLVLPLGLRNATQTFQRFLDGLLKDLWFCRWYIDDIIVFSRNYEEHLSHVRQLFDKLRSAGLCINLDKCQIALPEVIFLGFTVSQQGFKPPPPKVDAVDRIPTPTTYQELRSFLGALNYYRHCIRGAAQLEVPLDNLLRGAPKKKKAKLKGWTTAQDKALSACKQALKQATFSAFLAPDAELVVSSDASDEAIAGSVEQLINGKYYPAGFFSKKLTSAQRNYSTFDRELLGAYETVRHFEHYLEGREFVLRTDHKPLVHACRRPSSRSSPRQKRHMDYILQFNVNVQHISGVDNVVADTLSRACTIGMPSGLLAKDIEAAQLHDKELIHLLESGALDLQVLEIDGAKVACSIKDNLVKPYLPEPLRRLAFDVLHGPAHPSPRTTARALSAKFIWPHVRNDGYAWARACDPCQRAKVSRHNRAALQSFNVPENRFEHINIDLITLPQVQSWRYCFTIIDRFTRWPVAVPLADITADTVANALVQHWIAHYGCPITITSDQGTQFESALFDALARLTGAHHIHTTPYHPQSNGMIERLHRTIKAALMCAGETPWPQRLPIVLLGLRACYKQDLEASPAEMLYGTTLRLPGEFFVTHSAPAEQPTFAKQLSSLMRSIRPVPASSHSKPSIFEFADLKTCTHVYMRIDAVRKPLQPPYTGPHVVRRRVNGKVYVIVVNGKEKTVSTDALKPAYRDEEDRLLSPAADASPTPAPEPQVNTSPPMQSAPATPSHATAKPPITPAPVAAAPEARPLIEMDSQQLGSQALYSQQQQQQLHANVEPQDLSSQQQQYSQADVELQARPSHSSFQQQLEPKALSSQQQQLVPRALSSQQSQSPLLPASPKPQTPLPSKAVPTILQIALQVERVLYARGKGTVVEATKEGENKAKIASSSHLFSDSIFDKRENEDVKVKCVSRVEGKSLAEDRNEIVDSRDRNRAQSSVAVDFPSKTSNGPEQVNSRDSVQEGAEGFCNSQNAKIQKVLPDTNARDAIDHGRNSLAGSSLEKCLARQRKFNQKTEDKLRKYYGDSAPSRGMVQKWFTDCEYRCGRKSTNDAEHSDRPKEVTTQDMIDKVHDIILPDRRSKVREITARPLCNASVLITDNLTPRRLPGYVKYVVL